MSIVNMVWGIGDILSSLFIFILMEIKSENLKQRLHIASIFGFVLGTLYILVFNFVLTTAYSEYAKIHKISYVPLPFIESTLPGIILIIIAIICMIMSLDKIRNYYTKNII